MYSPQTYVVSGGALNSTHSFTHFRFMAKTKDWQFFFQTKDTIVWPRCQGDVLEDSISGRDVPNICFGAE